jgi:hypothetical protein
MTMATTATCPITDTAKPKDRYSGGGVGFITGAEFLRK